MFCHGFVMNQRYSSTSPPHDPFLSSRKPNVIIEMAVQVAIRFLFINPKKKAIGFVVFVALLSMIGALVTLDNSYYIVQKHSVFNQYGVKLGWMWTCLIVGPFIWLSSRAHYRDKGRAIIDLLRLAIATLCWYITVWQFGRITQWTSRCDLSIRYSKAECQAEGGVWILGFDISGHCFLMIYSMLVMSEEAHAFREWSQILHRSYDSGLARRIRLEKLTRLVEYFLVAMLVLNIIWVKQLTISVLYYHTLTDKVVGALVAVFWWRITYHGLYPAGFLQSPIHRIKDSSSKIR
ncbi:hypothetical protein Angca_002535 [Angiostrongylus cantonensis]|nr:hypothetical protein Angca_002535 [Angiostrongylus cantonensis]